MGDEKLTIEINGARPVDVDFGDDFVQVFGCQLIVQRLEDLLQ